MNKSVGYGELSKQYSEKYGTPPKESYAIIKNVSSLIKDNLNEIGDRVFLKDVISLQVIHRKDRIGSNPKTKNGEPFLIPAHNTIKATVNKGLKKQINK